MKREKVKLKRKKVKMKNKQKEKEKVTEKNKRKSKVYYLLINLGITIVEPNEEEIDKSQIAELKANQKKIGMCFPANKLKIKHCNTGIQK